MNVPVFSNLKAVTRKTWNLRPATFKRPSRSSFNTLRRVTHSNRLATVYSRLSPPSCLIRNSLNGVNGRLLTIYLRRGYASSSNNSDYVMIEGKSASTISRLWDKYKTVALGAGGAVAAVGLLGVTASALAVGGLATLAGGVYMWWSRRLRHQQNVLRELYEPLIENQRMEIEKYIGPFELPSAATIAADEAPSKTPSGGVEATVRNVFYLDGKWGKGFVRALGARHEEDRNKYFLRKLIIDLQDYKQSRQHTLTLVDKPLKIDFVEATSFKAYKLNDFIDIKVAARDAARQRARENKL